mgnify:FL=1
MAHYCIQRLSISKQSTICLHHPLLQAEFLLGHGSGRHGNERGNLCIAEMQADKHAKLAVGRRKLGKAHDKAFGSALIYSVSKFLQVVPLAVRKEFGLDAQLLHHFVCVYHGGSKRLHLPVEHPDTLALFPQQFQFAGHGVVFILLETGAE